MKVKICTICGKEFTATVWNKKICSDKCARERAKLAAKKWHTEHKDSENAKSRDRVAKYSKEERRVIARNSRINRGLNVLSKKKCTVCGNTYMPSTSNSKTCSIECRQTVAQNRAREYDYYNTNIQHKLRATLRNRLNKVINGQSRKGSAVRDLGCTIEELKKHLEDQFVEGMSWDNWTIDGWHIDHIIPLSSFDLSDPEELKRACHYTNLQPLWAKDNLRKNNSTGEYDDA